MKKKNSDFCRPQLGKGLVHAQRAPTWLQLQGDLSRAALVVQDPAAALGGSQLAPSVLLHRCSPWPSRCCPPPAAAHPAPMGAALLLQPGPPLQAAPAGVAEGKDPSCPQQTPQLSPQKPPARLLGVFLGKVSRDGAEPSKLVSFVAGAPPAPLGPLPPGGKASKG